MSNDLIPETTIEPADEIELVKINYILTGA